jgi:nucleotide-binding universal stress UspA family protein
MAIAVAYDGEEPARRALTVAIREAARKKTGLLLVYALAPDRVIKDRRPIVRSLSFSDLAGHYKKAISEAVQSVLEEAEREVEKAGLERETRVLNIGEGVGADIVRMVQEEREKIEMIVVGIKKTSPTGKYLLGSTAQYLILHAPCPVLSVNKDAV